ncbi:hypothetical protein ET495_00485 [Xylanimonas allomyrinae]|uniref:Uncharacterized protein n=1 Tax=Xylanimonas allomyrinae TaxID=2509459 RepID=A0A4P6EHL3_9MICO|nr:DUF6725 family protein [Xylanimonas allomyrinae]QAY62020.1 hypothetical protein ET495_00485 [Xylanimonas allomyrinae]
MNDATPWRDLPVGARVVVRRRLDPAESAQARAEGRGSVWTDVIGIVRSVDDAGLTVHTDAPRDPSPREVHIPSASIETAKRIPRRPTRSRR